MKTKTFLNRFNHGLYSTLTRPIGLIYGGNDLMFDRSRYTEEKSRIAKFYWRYYHTCLECGIKSKKRLIYVHPHKDGMVCLPCRNKLFSTYGGN